MTALHTKLLRDLWRTRGQLLTVALVVACGIATYVTMRGSYEAIANARQEYYGQYRFADVFAALKRAPNSLEASIAAIPGVSTVQTRIVFEVTLDVPGLQEPALGRLVSIPERGAPALNDLCIRRGRYLEPGQRDEVLVSEAFANLYQDFFRFPELRFVPTLSMIASAIAISGGAACFGALSALRSVVALPPAEAMRPEAPARFRPGLAERLGLQRFVPLSGRMILRNLERRPWKAVLSILGLAFAGAILIVGFYFYDAIDYLVRVEFQTAARDDVGITFNEPQGSSARYSVERLPGVLGAEPFRAVAARLRFEHRSRRIGILGLADDRDLRRIVDQDSRVIDLPSEGIVLSGSLARTLGVSPGDTLTIEVLEGERPVRSMIVEGTVEDLIGTSAYMNIHALNHLMREGETISGAYLSVDSLTAPKLYSFLKRTPAISGVNVREALLQSFRDTIARSLSISTGALIGFACVIAFGIVYNGALIALAERAHELASLRVLGFTRMEIGWMLLGEQAFLAGVSIPMGFLLGYAICGLLVYSMQSELYRMPLVISSRTYAFACITVTLASTISGLVIAQKLRNLDLVAVLKARE